MNMQLQQSPWRVDPRDKRFTEVVYGAPTLPKFPKTLGRVRGKVKDQDGSLSCTVQAATAAAEAQDGVEQSAAWLWKEVCKELGTYIPNGADWRIALKIYLKKGNLRQSLAQYSFPQDSPQIIGNWTNWKEQPTEVTEVFKKAAFVPIPKVGDWFDSVKAALVNGHSKKQYVMVASAWYSEWMGLEIPAPSNYTNLYGYHFHLFVDFDTDENGDFIWGQNSWGENIGDRGFQKWRRETVNQELSKWFAAAVVFEDLTEDQIALAKQETSFGWIQRQIIEIWNKISYLFV